MDDNLWNSRTLLLLGAENIEKLKSSHVLVAGLGGVGGYAAEMLCRAGIGKLTLVDGDVINPSNRNRQLLALKSKEGMKKAEIMKERLLDINPEIDLIIYPEYIKDERMIEIIEEAPYDYVVDAIDTLSPKIYLIHHSVKRNLKVVSSMGSGGKLDPSKVQIADIAQTFMCPLADILRKRLHKLGIYTGFKAVFSTEIIPADSVIVVENELNKKSTVGTVSYMPPLFGCLCASVVIRELIGISVESNLPIPKSVKKKITFNKD
jgi:tRNA A37 threonylcarbamoyladenosine dehydratase